MGHNSKKKKRSGSGRKGKARAASKDHSSHDGKDQELLSEELTALSAIFQEGIRIVLESPHVQFSINLRPRSNDMGTEDPDVSARLLVKCLPGYPQKCLKLQILPEKGLTKKDADQLFSLLVDQANINAREGRVMIFNLVEAAQEFLSEIVPVEQSLESVHCLGSERKDQSFHDAAVLPYANCHSEGLFVYGSIDLYSDLCSDDAPWSGGGTHVANRNSSKIFREHAQSIDKNRSKNILLHSAPFNIKNSITHDHFFENTKPEVHASKPGVVPRSFTNLDVLEEEAESNSRTLSPSPGVETDTLEKDSDSGLLEAGEVLAMLYFAKTNWMDGNMQ